MEATIFGGEGLSGWNPDVGSIRRKLAENPGATSQIVRSFREEFEFHFSSVLASSELSPPPGEKDLSPASRNPSSPVAGI